VTGLALAMVLASAVFHAVWNLFAKQARGGVAFVWMADCCSIALFAPVAALVLLLDPARFDGPALGFIAGSALLHLTYFVLLQRGYGAGDLSLVYPLARGTGPMLSTTFAVLLFGERPTPVALAGAALVGVGVFVLTGGPAVLGQPAFRGAVAYGLLTGLLIAGYTLWDKQAVSTFAVAPILLYYGGTVLRVALLAPYGLRRRPAIRDLWARHRGQVLGVALLSPLSYFLVLTALVFTPVSYVAPAREISILLGTLLGARLLAEGQGARRLAAAAVMVLGVVALAVG
jgi:drug/metabolite transporter (DMT)-like permease